MEFADILIELITNDELVCVPGLGGFISKEVSANLDPTTHIFTPPHKQVAFNERLSDDSNKLLHFLKKKENCTNEAASEKIRHFVDEVNQGIKNHSEYQVPGLGLFYKNNNGIGFTPNFGSEIDPSNFGLPKILIKSTPTEHSTKFLQKPKDRKAMSTLDLQSVPDPGSPGDNPSRTKNSKKAEKETNLAWLYIVTPILLLGGMGVFLGGTDDGRKMLANMHIISAPSDADSVFTENVIGDSTEAVATDGSSESFENAPSAEEAVKKTESQTWGEETVKSQQEVIAKTEDVSIATANIIKGKSGRCFIIVGGFSNKKNAVRLREKLVQDGLEAKILAPSESGGLYRVSLGDYGDLNSALQKANELKPSYGDNIWVKVY